MHTPMQDPDYEMKQELMKIGRTQLLMELVSAAEKIGAESVSVKALQKILEEMKNANPF